MRRESKNDQFHVQEVSVRGYRSIRRMRLPLQRINVIVGPNGVGKTNLYSALQLLHTSATHTFGARVAFEGGMQSLTWAGPRRKGPVRLSLGVRDPMFHYELSCGLRRPDSAFVLDPIIKEERLSVTEGRRSFPVAKRTGDVVRLRDDEGRWLDTPFVIDESEPLLGELHEPSRFPLLGEMRARLLRWRFYHSFRTDAESPLRRAQVGFRSPVLEHSGSNIAATLLTIMEDGREKALDDAVKEAFPGGDLHIHEPVRGTMEVQLQLPEFARPFSARELSDGTLKYLCLMAALLGSRPPVLIVLNEPEASLNESLLAPLSSLIRAAAQHTQIVLTTHSMVLTKRLEAAGAAVIELEKVNGATQIKGTNDEDDPEPDEESADEE